MDGCSRMAMKLSRNEKILRRINLSGKGLEIGPGCRPILPKSAGYNIETVDYLDRTELKRKFERESEDSSHIEDIDYVWTGGSLTDLIGRSHAYDFIIASHAIEHLPDLIGFLNDAENLLKEDGVLSLVVPDKRFCFDYFRPVSGLARVIDAYLNQSQIHSAGTAVEHFLYHVENDARPAWTAASRKRFKLRHTVEEARLVMQEITKSKKYFDVHAWCFTPSSFRFLLHSLSNLGMINLNIIDYYPTEGFEFFVSLTPGRPETEVSRLEMLEMVRQELRMDSMRVRLISGILQKLRRIRGHRK